MKKYNCNNITLAKNKFVIPLKEKNGKLPKPKTQLQLNTKQKNSKDTQTNNKIVTSLKIKKLQKYPNQK